MEKKVDRQESVQEDMPYRQDFGDDSFEEDPNAFMDEPDEEEQKERLVVRFVPVAIDYVIFFIQLSILGSYFYVAYIWKGLDTARCKADIGSDTPLSPEASNQGIDVAAYYMIAIRWGFWMSLLTFIRAILAQVGLYLKRWVLLWCSYVLFAANISISIVLFILMQVWRWSHAGQVCSGDFLENTDDAPEGVYLIFEGKFIKGILILVYSILGLSCLSIAIVSVCVFRRNRNEDKAEENSDVKMSGLSNSQRQSAFTKALDPDYELAMRDTAMSIKKKKFFNSQNTEAPQDEQLLL